MNFSELKTRFNQELDDKSKIAIGYHPDADGTTTAALLLKKLGLGKEILLKSINNASGSLESEQVERVHEFSPEAMIYLDAALRNIDQVEELKQRGIWTGEVDHHGYVAGINEALNLFVNTVDEGVPGRTASELMQNLVGNKETRWLAKVGLCGDVVPGDYDRETQESAKKLNFVGLAQKKGEPLSARDQLAREMVLSLVGSSSAEEFLGTFERYHQVSTEVDQVVDRLKKAEGRETGSSDELTTDRFRDETLVRCYFPRGEFNIIEQILKTHLPQMGKDITTLLYTGQEGDFDVRLYTTSQRVALDCGTICRSYGGGGHKHRAGIRSTRGNGEGVMERISNEVIDCLND